MADILYATTVLPDAYPGVAYEASIAVKGNATAVTAASVATGTLPPGLTVNADHVRITGTVTGVHAAMPKTYTFTLSHTDTAGTATSGTYTITVREPALASPGLGGGFGTLPVAAQMAQQWPLTQS